MAVFLVNDIGRGIVGENIQMSGGAGIMIYDDIPYTF